MSAPRWILLRGLTRERGHWGEFPAQLSHALGGAPVDCIDLPGNGALHRERSPASVDAMVDACRARLREADVPPPYRLVAMSLGAMVSVAWAARHPGEVAGAVLINTSLRPFAGTLRRLRPRNYLTLLRIASSRDAERAERLILQMTSRTVAPDATAGRALLQRWTALRRDHPVSPANGLRQLWAAARFRAPLERSGVPLLLLAGAQDGLVDPECSRRIAAAWKVELHEHPRAGHDLPLDAPEWVIERIDAWATGVG